MHNHSSQEFVTSMIFLGLSLQASSLSITARLQKITARLHGDICGLQGAAAEDDLEEDELEFSDDEKVSCNFDAGCFLIKH